MFNQCSSHLKKAFFSIFLIYLLTCISQTSVYAQVRKYSNEFLSIGVGARALGMSNAYVTSVNDVTSGYWNPAGLVGIRSNIQLAGMHAEYFAGLAKFDYGAIGLPIDSMSAISLSIIRFGIDDIPNTIELVDPSGNINYDKITSFSAADNAYIVSYARKMKIPGLRVGVNAKVIHRKVGDFARAWGFGADAGLQYDFKGYKFGLMARDITTTFNAWQFNLSDRMKEVFAVTGNEIPENSIEITAPKLILGSAKIFRIKEVITLMPEFNLEITTDGKRNVLIPGKPFSIDPKLGTEIGYRGIVFLRAGIGNFQRIKSDLGNRDILTYQPNIGVGVKIKNLTIDYALANVGETVGRFSNVFSLRLDIYKKQ
jgi:hypothetical protein